MATQSVKSIIKAIGSEVLERELEVSSHSLRNAAWKNRFPASWNRVVEALCEKKGLDCPDNLFAFKPKGKSITPSSATPENVGVK